jgi:hypothetical protein
MDRIIDALDGLPVATLLVILAALGGVYELVAGNIDYEHFLLGLGVASGGTAALGHVRNKAGKGVVVKPGPRKAVKRG